jgi:hypothetical protein
VELAMKMNDLDYTTIEVDERLLVFQSCMMVLFNAQFRGMASVIDERAARKALLQTQEMFGYARRRTLPDGGVRLEATEKYIRDMLEAE